MVVDVVTFGCRLNSFESEVMKQHAATAKMENTIIVNTCAVTAEAERQARQSIRKLRRKHPDANIIVTGCSAQIDPTQYASMEEVDLVLGNEEKLRASSYLNLKESNIEKSRVNDIMSIKETASHLITSFEGKARAFVQVQNGCNHRCTFCIIPFGRGNSRSIPVGDIVQQVRLLVEQDYNEIVLTGVDVSDYGKDLPGQPTLGQMIRRLLALVPELPRLRLSSIDAVEIDEDLYRLLAEEPRLMPHLHISLQSGDDMILKRMKRRHNRQDILDFCDRVRKLRPDVVFGADIIAGFPTETEAMFENSLKLIEEAGLLWLHVFPYSEREGTPAARMPQLPVKERKLRAELLRKAGETQLQKHLEAQYNTDVSILMEKEHMGRSEHFIPVKTTTSHTPGDIITCRITGIENKGLVGEKHRQAAA